MEPATAKVLLERAEMIMKMLAFNKYDIVFLLSD
jgi:hypothetical protein